MKRGRTIVAVLVLGGCLRLGSSAARAQFAPKPAELALDRPAPAPLTSTEDVVYPGRASPGSTLTLGLTGPGVVGDQYLWTQLEGPPVAIDDPRAAKIRFQVPAGAGRLVFLVGVTNRAVTRRSRVVVPVSAPTPQFGPAPSTGPVESGPLPTADPGDDQVGLVGRRITLDGSRSEPRGHVGFRWMQVSGPAIAEARQDGGYFSFVPTAPGLHRFALLAGHQSRVSMPAVITVEVGQRPPAATGTQPAAPDGMTPLARWAATAVASIPSGVKTASQVADVFEGVSARVPLFKSFAELQSELSRRLDVVIPIDPATRQLWSGQVFGPLSQITAAELLPAGVDLRIPSTFEQPLEPAAKERIGTFYRNLAEAFRASMANPQP